jgi:hypothetical protein
MYTPPCMHSQLPFRKSLYIVEFADLTYDLQIEFMKALFTRGMDDELAGFLVEYVKRKAKLVNSLPLYK